ncbi:3242_t:CDS:2 [Diversispora eburnea]|uniref:3242_t:CDS:1 n=1 Tax=Diversispora eburnea TaxID=1213867 RepID=A0A9N9FRI0_9GLOM|nr:3242_t:CDS:2 [Diversispora eburnea]
MSLKPMNGFQPERPNNNNIYSKLLKKQPLNIPSKFALYLVEHQIEFPLIILTILGSAYLLKVPGSEKFFFLQNKNPNTGLYRKSKDDAYFISFWVILFTLLRAFIMDYILIPLAKMGGIRNDKRTRFAEQGWSFLYYSVFWTIGMYIMYQSPHWFDTSHYWKGYPHIELTSLFKGYYLIQFAFWLQQIFVLYIEKKRKDFVEMVAHHVITISLMFFSYIFNFVRIGNAVLCTMDFTDVILPFAKMIKYLKFNKICDFIFGLFIISWLITRHYFYGHIIYSAWTEPQKYLEFKWSPEEDYYLTKNVQIFFLILFISLQILIIFWFYLICNILNKVIRGDNAHDNRSESEG